MYENQHTLKEAITISGIGLHTGEPVSLSLCPAPAGHGFKFRRIDLPGNPEIPALTEFVVDTSRGTTLGIGNAKVHTVEHVLAALVGLQVDNALIEIDGPEPPALDGSSAPYVAAIEKAGIREINQPREFFVIDEPIHFADPKNQVELSATPLNDFKISVIVDYNTTVLGSQHANLLDISDFKKEISGSRTFSFLHELEQLLSAGLIKGGDLSNAIVMVDKDLDKSEIARLGVLFKQPNIAVVKQGILNNLELRFDNEPARHKLLDLLGDLALVGHPLKGQITATRPGHHSNVEFAKKITSSIRKQKLSLKYQSKPKPGVVFDINAIHKILPHRYPFLLVDRITEFSDSKIVGIKNVTVSEPYFQGHFEGNPVMPGVLQLEAMGQVGGIMLLNRVEDPALVWVYFLAIDNARFKKPVTPGDRIEFHLELLQFKRNICKMKGQGFVDGILVCEAELTAAIVKKEETSAPKSEVQVNG